MATLTPHKIWLGESAIRLLLPLLLTSLPSELLAFSNDQKIIRQIEDIEQALRRCFAVIANATVPEDGGLYCQPVWDNVMCWPQYVRAGEIATQPCPAYIDRFNPHERAVRSCTEDGTWEKNPAVKTNNSWTNFRSCIISTVPEIIEENMPIVIQISTIGYSISLGTLIVATAIMIAFKRLHCQRNTIHINLFISFMFRAVISLLRNTLLVKHFALPGDITYDTDGRLNFIHEGTHWECKLLNTLWQYSLNANYMWIFVEGLYLHTLIFFAVFSQSRKFFKLYILIGWVLPLIFIINWAFVRIFKNNTLCWNTHDKGFYWILNAPIVFSILVNFFFFLNIIRVLFTKIRDCNTRDPRRYSYLHCLFLFTSWVPLESFDAVHTYYSTQILEKLAKSTLVLIPLFGVYYIFFIALSEYREPRVAVAHMYMEMTLNSFQGTVVALLFCFLNGEVRAEIMKKWHRHRLRRQSVVSGRSSRALSTTSYCIGRDRASLPLGIPLGDAMTKAGRVSTPTQSPINNNNNGRMFRKISSMPKIPTDLCISPNNPITRVESSPKVTFHCDDAATDHNADFSRFPEDSPPKPNNHTFCNGVHEMPKSDERKTLLSDTANKDTNNGNDTSKSCFKIVNFLRDMRVFKSTAVGVTDEESSVLPRVHCVNDLPPLSDVEEDASDTLAPVN